jgi:acyl-CoA synthetase (AMP-forming)/AMP-acid ligase II
MATTVQDDKPKRSDVSESWDRSTNATQRHIGCLLERLALKYPDHTAVASFHQSGDWERENSDDEKARLTFAELHALGVKLASHLISKGTRRSDRVMVALYNQVEWCIAFWATAYLGCQFVPLDPRSLARTSDAAHFVQTIRPNVVLVATSLMAGVVDEALQSDMPPPIRVLVQSTGKLGHDWDLMAAIFLRDLQDTRKILSPPTGSEDTAIIFFTSGTGALPKACPLSTVNITAPAYAFATLTELGPSHHICQHLPGFHIFSVLVTLSAWLQGAAVVFPSPTFDPEASIRVMENTRNLHVPCVPTMVQAMVNHPRASQPFPSLVTVTLGGTVVPGHVIDLVKSMGPKRIAVGYGMSEGVLTLLDVQNGKEARPRTQGEVSVGVAVSGAKIRICDPGSRVPLRRGDVGELHQGGLPVFGGYLNFSEESCYVEGSVNFIATGDQAFMDDEGYVYILGRYKDLIIRGGENISPAKIEHYLADAYGLLVSDIPGYHPTYRY